MRTADKQYFDKHAIDPFGEAFMFDALVDGWVDDVGSEESESDDFYVDDWEDLI